MTSPTMRLSYMDFVRQIAPPSPIPTVSQLIRNF
jgi:hypothetical protein